MNRRDRKLLPQGMPWDAIFRLDNFSLNDTPVSINLANHSHTVLFSTQYQLANLFIEGVSCILTQQNDTFSNIAIFYCRCSQNSSKPQVLSCLWNHHHSANSLLCCTIQHVHRQMHAKSHARGGHVSCNYLGCTVSISMVHHFTKVLTDAFQLALLCGKVVSAY